MGPVAKRWLSAVSVAVLSAGLIVGVSTPAAAALGTGPTVTGVTGSRPGATELPFAISDQVSASVDVATGNLRVSTQSLSLVGVNGPVGIGQSYNSLSSTTSSALLASSNRWTFSVQGVGFLSAASTGGGVVYTDGSGATWPFNPGTGGAYVAPAGAKADLAAVAGGQYTLTDRQSRQVTTFNTDGYPVSIADRNGNATAIGYSTLPGNPSSVVSTAGPVAARTATITYGFSSGAGTLTASQTSGSSSRSVKWVKDVYSNLTSIVDAEGKTTTFDYGSSSGSSGTQLKSITGPTGAVVTFAYESVSSNRVVSVSQANTTAGSPGTSVTRFAYPNATTRYVA